MNIKIKDLAVKTNVRTDLGDLSSLVQSIKEIGVMTPVTVRKEGGKFVLLAGHRRLAASKLAGVDSIPAHVLSIDEEDIQTAQLAENLHRKDLTPLEVATTIGQELTKRGFNLDHEQVIPAGLDEVASEIATKCGMSKVYVKAMARLAFLPPEFRKLLENDNLPVNQALLILSLPPAQQQKLAKDQWKLMQLKKRGEQIPMSDLESYITRSFGKALATAPFPLDEPVGNDIPCLTCQYNTSNTPELFDTKSKEGICRMADCYRRKCQAISSEVKRKEDPKGLKFVGYASYGMFNGEIPETIKGMEVVEKMSAADKKKLEIDYAQAKVAKEKKGTKLVDPTFGYAIIRAKEGRAPVLVYVRLKAKEKKPEQPLARQYDPWSELIQGVLRKVNTPLILKPMAKMVKEVKLTPDVLKVIAGGINVSDALELMGVDKPTMEDVFKACLLGMASDGDENAIRTIGFDVEKVEKDVANKIVALKSVITGVHKVPTTYYGWPEKLKEELAVNMLGGKLVLSTPKPIASDEMQDMEDEDDQG